MSWSTVEWPPKNSQRLKTKPKRKRVAKVLLLGLLAIVMLAAIWGLDKNHWQYPFNFMQQKINYIEQYLFGTSENEDAKELKQSSPAAKQVHLREGRTDDVDCSPPPVRQYPQQVSRGGEQFRYIKEYEMLATAYTHTGNPTASGQWPKVGVVAVDTKVIPMGTRLYVEGYGYATALDRGGAIKGNRIDLFMETEQQALKWGAKKIKVYLLE